MRHIPPLTAPMPRYWARWPPWCGAIERRGSAQRKGVMEIFHHALCFPNPAVTSRRNGASAGPAGAQGRPAAPGAAFPAPAFRCGIHRTGKSRRRRQFPSGSGGWCRPSPYRRRMISASRVVRRSRDDLVEPERAVPVVDIVQHGVIHAHHIHQLGGHCPPCLSQWNPTERLLPGAFSGCGST